MGFNKLHIKIESNFHITKLNVNLVSQWRCDRHVLCHHAAINNFIFNYLHCFFNNFICPVMPKKCLVNCIYRAVYWIYRAIFCIYRAVSLNLQGKHLLKQGFLLHLQGKLLHIQGKLLDLQGYLLHIQGKFIYKKLKNENCIDMT